METKMPRGKTVMGKRVIFASSIVLCVLIAQARPAKDSGYAYRAGVEEVRLTFSASDRYRRDVQTLTAADVAVVDNGTVVRAFRSFTRLPQVNLKVMVLVDASGSVASRFRREIDDVVGLVGDKQWQADDMVSVLSFGGTEPNLVCARNCRDSAAAASLSMLRANGLTPLYDALVLAAEAVAVDRGVNFRNVLIVFSDGQDTISRNSLADAIETAQRNDALIYTLDMNNPKFITTGGAILEMMANATGGRRFPMEQGAATALKNVIEDARSAYVLTYPPVNRDAGPHWVRILPTKDLSLRFRCRQGYYYENDLHPRSMP